LEEREMSDLEELLRSVVERVARYRETVGERPVAREVDVEALRAKFGGGFPERGAEAGRVVDELVEMVEPGLVATI
jgi:hypothetical protein